MTRTVIRRCAIVLAAWVPFFAMWLLVAVSFARDRFSAVLVGSLIDMGSAGLLGIGVWYTCRRWPWPLGFRLKFYLLDYVTVCTATKQYLVSIRLSDLEGHLDGANFLRIHRSHLINLEYVTSIEPYDAARVQVVMKSGIRIVASRTGSKRLRDLAL